jgi:hypothetical protein
VNFYIEGDVLYYLDENGLVKKSDLAGGAVKTLRSKPVSRFAVLGGRIYYEENGGLYLDGAALNPGATLYDMRLENNRLICTFSPNSEDVKLVFTKGEGADSSGGSMLTRDQFFAYGARLVLVSPKSAGQ